MEFGDSYLNNSNQPTSLEEILADMKKIIKEYHLLKPQPCEENYHLTLHLSPPDKMDVWSLIVEAQKRMGARLEVVITHESETSYHLVLPDGAEFSLKSRKTIKDKLLQETVQLDGYFTGDEGRAPHTVISFLNLLKDYLPKE